MPSKAVLGIHGKWHDRDYQGSFVVQVLGFEHDRHATMYDFLSEQKAIVQYTSDMDFGTMAQVGVQGAPLAQPGSP